MADAALEADRALVDLGLAALGGGAWVYDVGADAFRCDAAVARLFGLSRVERTAGVPIGRVSAAVHPDDLERFHAQRRFTLRFGGDFSLEYRTVAGFRIMSRGRYVADDAGAIVEARGIVFDLTGRDADRSAQVLTAAAVDAMQTGPAFERAAMLVVAAHRAIRDSGGSAWRLLRPAADALLAETLRVIALSAPGRGASH